MAGATSSNVIGRRERGERMGAPQRDNNGQPHDDHVARFLEELRNEAAGSVTTGMVKACEDDESALMFAHIGDTSHWVKISGSTIKRVEKVGRANCLGHSYQVVRLVLAPPAGDNAKIFADLANLHSLKLQKVQTALARGKPSPFAASAALGCPEGYTQIFDAEGRAHCVPDFNS